MALSCVGFAGPSLGLIPSKRHSPALRVFKHTPAQCLGEPGWKSLAPSAPFVPLGPGNRGAYQPGVGAVAAQPQPLHPGVPGVQAHTPPYLQASCLCCLAQGHRRSRLGTRDAGAEDHPRTAPICFALSWHSPHGLCLPSCRALLLGEGLEGRCRRRRCQGPTTRGNPVPAGLLGATLLLCLHRGEVTWEGTVGGRQG